MTRSPLNFRLTAKVNILVPIYGVKTRDVPDHPFTRFVSYTSEEIPDLSQQGVTNGNVRFITKCVTPATQTTTYRPGSPSDG